MTMQKTIKSTGLGLALTIVLAGMAIAASFLTVGA